LTAGNDGTVCHWDLTSTSVRTGAPKLLDQSGKGLHASGIFSMDICFAGGSSQSGTRVVTGSKDKTISVSTLDRLNDPLWRSDHHTSKVGCVSFSSSSINSLITSASDDGLVAIHDARLRGMKGGSGGNNGVVASLEDAHVKPHSAVWRPGSDCVFTTGEYFSDCLNFAYPLGHYLTLLHFVMFSWTG
jgi:WD40 repeat protein